MECGSAGVPVDEPSNVPSGASLLISLGISTENPAASQLHFAVSAPGASCFGDQYSLGPCRVYCLTRCPLIASLPPDLGRITIASEAGGFTTVLEYEDGYEPVTITQAITGGEDFLVTAEGSEGVAPFQVAGVFPGPVLLESPSVLAGTPLEVDRDEPLELEWSGGASDVTFNFQAPGAGATVLCYVPSEDGVVVIPSDALRSVAPRTDLLLGYSTHSSTTIDGGVFPVHLVAPVLAAEGTPVVLRTD